MRVLSLEHPRSGHLWPGEGSPGEGAVWVQAVPAWGTGRARAGAGGQPFPMSRQGSPSTTRASQNTLTRNSVADPDKDFLKVGEVAPGRLEHVHEAVDEQVLHPADRDMVAPLHTLWPRFPLRVPLHLGLMAPLGALNPGQLQGAADWPCGKQDETGTHAHVLPLHSLQKEPSGLPSATVYSAHASIQASDLLLPPMKASFQGPSTAVSSAAALLGLLDLGG